MRRLSIIVIIVTLCALTSLSQPRVNSSKTYSVVASSQILSYPVGWEFNDLGKWCGYYGVISGDYQNNSKVPKRLTAYAMSGYNSKGIVSLQFKKIKSLKKHTISSIIYIMMVIMIILLYVKIGITINAV